MVIKQYYYKIPVGGVIKSNIEANELKSGIRNLRAKRLGIQAPAGTSFELNGHVVIIGRSGIYQFEDDELQITSIKVVGEPVAGIIIDILEE